MRKLIENSIRIKKLGGPTSKNIFDVLSEGLDESLAEVTNSSILRSPRYIDISKFPGKSISVFFNYEEDNIISPGFKEIVIPDLNTEVEVKNYIVSEIESHINNI
jgi:hypothetical protein